MNRREFERVWKRYTLELVGPLGFRHYDHGAFFRERNGLWEGLGWFLERPGYQFRVPMGIHVPALRSRHNFIVQDSYAAMDIGHHLGQLRSPNCVGHEARYSFRSREELEHAIERMSHDFVNEALPWYERFGGLEDVAIYYYKWRIEDTPERTRLHGPKPADPFAWAMYGWMLEELGRRDEAMPWLQRAYEEVTRPLFIDKSGRFVSEGTKEAKLYRHPEPEERLEELLRQSLDLPVPQQRFSRRSTVTKEHVIFDK